MKRIVFLLLVVVVLAGCKSSKHLATSEKNVQVSSYLTSKLQLTIPGKKGGSMSVGGTMKMKTHERVQISLLMPILRTEVARVEVTPDGVLLVDRMNKRFVRATKDEYNALVRSKFGEKSFDEMISFAKECTKYIPNVVLTTVDTTISHEEEAECQKLCDEIGAAYRIRPWED